MSDQTVDCIVRFHDDRRLHELNRCIFSLLGQSHRPLNIILALQRFSAEQVAATEAALAPLLGFTGAPSLTLCNLDQVTPVDARTLLLNMGLQAARGRYLTFLDYDDVLYPEAYALLSRQLQVSGAAIAFATVRVARVDVFPQFLHTASEVAKPFGDGNCLRDLFDGNFCPIHSFMIDRSRVDAADLMFDTALTWEEDYDLLIRLCAKYRSDFQLIQTRIGDYYYKRDGSNSIPVDGLQSAAQIQGYERIVTMIEARRRTTLVAPGIQAEHGISPPQPGMTIRDFMTAVPGRA